MNWKKRKLEEKEKEVEVEGVEGKGSKKITISIKFIPRH